MPDYVDTARKAIDEQLASLRDEIKRFGTILRESGTKLP